MTTHEILKRARDLIRTPRQWCKGLYHTASGAFCASGALTAAGARHGKVGAFRALKIVCGYGCIVKWNDDPKTTHADVMRAFDKAIRATKPKKKR